MTSQKNSLYTQDCGYTKQELHSPCGVSMGLAIQKSLTELYSQYSIQKVILSGTNVGHFLKDNPRSTYNQQEIEVVSCFVSPRIKEIYDGLSLLKTLCPPYELGSFILATPSWVQKSLRHRQQRWENMMRSVHGLTATMPEDTDLTTLGKLWDLSRKLAT